MPQQLGWTPTQLALLAAWIAMLTVSFALVLLMRGILALSERRAAFVSAVTHELRTPLTTFRMYTEMLLGGMVPSTSRDQYLQTLHGEADRLTHLVENVLAYARLEGRRGPLALEQVSIGQLLDTARQRLADRATQADLELNVEADSSARSAEVRTNPLAVEQILFNLVDNACKYAKSQAKGVITLTASANNGHAQLTVSDSGPGIAAPERGRLFQPFHKSAHEAADTAAGVGLGLALSRRLARQMGGDLHYRPVNGSGACFELTLPSVS
jgi:signal transduction histidine kinase